MASEKVSSVYTYSKELVVGPPPDPLQSLLDELLNEQSDIVPVKKLDELVKFTYEIEKFEFVSGWIQDHLKVFKYKPETIKQTINILTIVYYLIKHGVSGFIDIFRGSLKMFKNYQMLEKREIVEDDKKQKEIDNQMDIIVNKARHIEILLTDKDKLLREKDLAMLIKQKVKLHEEKQKKEKKQAETNNTSENNKHNPTNNTFNDLLQNYLWRYVDSLDDKIENVTEKVLTNWDKLVDRVLDGPTVEKFQLEEAEEEKQPQKTEVTEKDVELIKKISKEIEDIEIKEEDLLELEDKKQKPKSPIMELL